MSYNVRMNSAAKPSRRLNWKPWAAILTLVAVAVICVRLHATMPRLALFMVFGLVMGFILQRSRFCFVSAISNCFISRDTRLIEGILGGLFLATLGFACVMYRLVPDPATGGIPFTAIVSPFGWHLALGGVLFGIGMLLSGGCIIGSLFRVGEGGVSALVAFLGVIVGMGILQFTWPWWWQHYVSKLPAVWLPAQIGWIGAVALTLIAIVVLFLIARRIRTTATPATSPPKAVKSGARLTSAVKSFPAKAWPLASGGILLGIVNVILFQIAGRPWTVTGEVMSWAQGFFALIHLPPPPFDAVPGT